MELATWSRLLAWDRVADLFGVSWATVVMAVEQAVAYGLARRDLSGLRVIGVDELSRKKGHVYHTNVYDMASEPAASSGRAMARARKTLERFFRDIGDEAGQTHRGGATYGHSGMKPMREFAWMLRRHEAGVSSRTSITASTTGRWRP